MLKPSQYFITRISRFGEVFCLLSFRPFGKWSFVDRFGKVNEACLLHVPPTIIANSDIDASSLCCLCLCLLSLPTLRAQNVVWQSHRT